MACQFPDCEGGAAGTYCKASCHVKLTSDKAAAVTDDLAFIVRNAIAYIKVLEAELARCKQVCAATSESWRIDAEKWKGQRDALLEALKQIEPILARMYGPQAAGLPPMQIVRAAIAKAEENT